MPVFGGTGNACDKCISRIVLACFVKRILLIRLSALGDVVFATTLINSFRRRYPQAHLAWMVAQPFADVLASQTQLDEIIILPVADWGRLARAGNYLQLLAAVKRFYRDLRARQFDVAIDLQGLLKSGTWAWLSGAPQRIGLGSREGSQHLMTRTVDRRGGPRERIASEYLHLARELGLETDGFGMHVAVSERGRQQADNLLRPRIGNATHGVICPFTTRPQKHWLVAHWQALVPLLEARFGLPVVMLGGPGDRAAASDLAAGCGVVDLAGQTDIQGAAAVIAGAAYVIGVDTGLTHMGIALGRPTLCLFGSTRPYTDTATGRARVLYHDMPCAPCRRHPTCDGRFDCMRAITPAEVAAALAELVERGAR